MHKLNYVHVLIPEKDERSGTRPDHLAICEIAFLIYDSSFGTLMLRPAICSIFYQRLLLLGFQKEKDGWLGWLLCNRMAQSIDIARGTRRKTRNMIFNQLASRIL